jgi:hypothetical protein
MEFKNGKGMKRVCAQANKDIAASLMSHNLPSLQCETHIPPQLLD